MTETSKLRALFFNCTLKPTPQSSNTEGLLRVPAQILRSNGVEVEVVRPVDHVIPPGVHPDMKSHGFERDDWPRLFERVLDARILVVGTPIWLGEPSSVCRRLIERLYGMSGELKDDGQYVYYGRVGGCIVTGNEDGAKHCAASVLYGLQHLGFTIPPQADAAWVGEAGPGPSYCDEDSGGLQNDYTQRTATFMAWNLLHLARLLDDAGGIPAQGNQRSKWAAGCRFDHPNPDYR
jgi:multimeric flavodoxin WrbA